MDYRESFQKSSEITRMVIHALSKLQIPINPITYSLWYEYFLNRSSGLEKELGEIISNDKAYSPDLGQQLFLRYIVASDIEKLEKIEKDIFNLLNNIVKIVTSFGIDVSEYGNSLNSSANCLTSNDNILEIRKIVDAIVTDTQSMKGSNREYEHKLKDTSNEIDLLRKELKKVRQEASQDTLTGLSNRKAFDEALAEGLNGNSDADHELCLLMIDIDHFKKVNDTYGHIIGDQVLKYVSDTLKQAVKGRDMVARYGGEEFGIILKETPLEGAVTLAEDIRQKVESSQLKQKGTGKIISDITISIGVECGNEYDTCEDLINKADKALYHSKRTGRNKVSCLNPKYLHGQ